MNKLKQIKLIRFLICVSCIPCIFIYLRGHIKKKGLFSVSASGGYVPWLTYPFIDYFENHNLSDCSVFEYGAGSSTFWWSERVLKVVSVEMEKKCFEYLYKNLPTNVEISLCQDGGLYPSSIRKNNVSFVFIYVCVYNACSGKMHMKHKNM